MSYEKGQLVSNRYQMVRKLGQGGMGAVYQAFDLLHRQAVAFKSLQADFDQAVTLRRNEAEVTKARLALAHEFQVLSSLRHPHIISVNDYGFDDERQPYLTMSLIENAKTIREAAREQPIEGKVKLLIQMLQALSYLHRRGIIHRDLKPDNALVNEQGDVKVLDFGLAVPEQYRHTTSSSKDFIAGTLAYIAPEVLQGVPASEVADLYAVGVIAYEIFAGRHPFDLRNISKLFYEVAHKLPDMSPFLTLRIGDEAPPPPEGGDEDRTRLLNRTVADRTAPVINTGLDEMTTMLPTQAGQLTADPARTAPIHNDSDEAGKTTLLNQTTLDRTWHGDSEPSISDLIHSFAGVAPGVSLGKIVARLLAKTPHERYSSASEVISALSAAIGQPSPTESIAIRESYLQAARFVGRQRELSQLVNALGEALHGRGNAWLIGGESGVGKSRLLTELRTEAMVRGTLVLQGQAVAEGGLPYQLWREPVRRLLLAVEVNDIDASILKNIVPDIGELLGRNVLDAPELEGQAGQQRFMNTIGTVFRKCDRAIMLMLEDLQWAVESLDMLKHLLAMLSDLPLLVIASYRDDETPELANQLPTMQVIKLERLSDQAIADLAVSMLGDAGRQPGILELLKTESEGNVFFLVEIVRALAEEAGQLTQIGEMVLPKQVLAGGVQQIVQRRLDRVPSGAQPLLKVAAVAGRELDLEVLRAIDPEIDLEQWLTICANAAVLEVASQQWRFAHDKLRQGLLRSLSDRERYDLHLQVATAIQSAYPDGLDAYAAVIADHYERAGERAQAVIWYQRAGVHAQMSYAAANAVTYYRKVLDYWSEDADSISVSLTERIDVLNNLGKMLIWQASYAEAIEIFEQMLTLADVADNVTAQVHAWYGIATVQVNQGDLHTALETLSQAEEAGRTADARLALSRALWLKGVINYRLSNAEATLALSQQVLALSGELGHRGQMAHSLNLMGAVHYALGDYQKASGHFEQALAIFQELGDRGPAVSLINNLGWLAQARGDYHTALARYQEAFKIAHEIGIRDAEMLFLSNIGGVRIRLGEYAAAADNLQQVIEIAKTARFGQLSETYCFLAEACLGLSNYQGALVAAQEAMTLGQKVGSPEYIAAAWRILGQVAAHFPRPILVQNQPDSSQHYDAVACFGESDRIYKETGMEGERARTLREWARYELLYGDKAHGRVIWQEARDIFTRLGADAEVAQMNNLPGPVDD